MQQAAGNREVVRRDTSFHPVDWSWLTNEPERCDTMVRALIVLGVLGVATGRASCAPMRATGNLLRNPGFEDGTNRPAGWSFNHRGTEGDITWDKTRSHRGARSVRLANRRPEQTGNVLQTLRIQPPLPPGSRVHFGASAAAKNVRGSGPLIILNLMSTGNVRQDASARGVGGTHDFVPLNGEVLVTRPSNRLVMYLCHYGTGTVWWDDATLTVQRAGPSRIVPRPAGGRRLPRLAAGNGLCLVFSSTGAVVEVQLDDHRLPNTSPHSGLWVHPVRGDMIPVTGRLREAGGEIEQRFEDPDTGLRIVATFKAGKNLIACAGAVEDLTGADRGVEVLFSLPGGDEGWRWGNSIREEVPLAAEPHSVQFTTFSSVSQPETGRGVTLAVPADRPTDCEFTWEEQFGYAVRFRFGLSPAASGDLKSRAPFAFVLYRCDGDWGFRDAARRYYALYPDAFKKRVTHEGLWMFGSPRFALPDPQNYAFREGGPAGWEYDDRHHLATCPYLIPGQREIGHLKRLPANEREAMTLFRTWRPHTPKRGSGWGEDLKEIIENCLLEDADGQPRLVIRNTPWGGNSVTFPLNANPALFTDSPRATVAKALLAHVRQILEETPAVDGIYVDSLGAWGDFLNHRHRHFAYSTLPLTYDPDNGRPVIDNSFALLEFLRALGKELHKHGKLVFPNGLHQTRRFHFFASDVLGVEGHGYLEQKRVMAYQKPFLLLIYNVHDKPAKAAYYYHLCTFYGIYPSFGNLSLFETPESYAPIAALNNRFVPVLRALGGAGWQPVTWARSTDKDVWLERWGQGPRGPVYLTAYNAARQARRPVLTIDPAPLGLRTPRLRLEDQLSGDHWECKPGRKGTVRVAVEIPPHRTRVLLVRRASDDRP